MWFRGVRGRARCTVRKCFAVILCLILLAGCKTVVVSPPPGKATALLGASFSAGGKEIELSFESPEKNIVYDVTGEITFEFSSPVDLASLKNNENFCYGNAERTKLVTEWPSWEHSIQPLLELTDDNGKKIVWPHTGAGLTRIPFPRATIALLNYPEVLSPAIVGKGETVNIEFDNPVDQGFVLEQIRANLHAEYRENWLEPTQKKIPQFSLEWAGERSLHFTVLDSPHWTVVVRAEKINIAMSFHVMPRQSIVVARTNGDVLTSMEVPLSIWRAIGMSDDHAYARLVRPFLIEGGPDIGLWEYRLDLANGNFTGESRLTAYGWSERYFLYDWMKESKEAYSRLDFPLRAVGLSNDGRYLAAHEYTGEVWIWDLATGEKQTISVPLKPQDDGYIPSPHWMFWSVNDELIFYNALLKVETQDPGLYVVNRHTGQERLLIEDHYLITASPFSEHLFTEAYIGGYPNSSLNIVDYSGVAHTLGQYPERLTLAKWIDAERALINRQSGPMGDWQCYIYYLNSREWEHLAEGYGFDYDSDTGRVFLLRDY
jgi:hypothetical protein